MQQCGKAKGSQGCSHIKLSWVSITLEWAKQNQDCGKEKADPLLCNQTQEQRAKCQPPQKASTSRTQVAFCWKKDEAITSIDVDSIDVLMACLANMHPHLQGCYYFSAELPGIRLIYLQMRFKLLGLHIARIDMFPCISNTILPSISPTYSRISSSLRSLHQHATVLHFILFLTTNLWL